MPIRLRWGDPLPAIPGNIEVHALRLLRVVRLRVRGEVEHAGERDPHGAEDWPLRDSSQQLRAEDLNQ